MGGWAARWLRVYKRPDVSAATYQTTYEITVRRHILPHLGDRVMMDLTPVDIKMCIRDRGNSWQLGLRQGVR